jgi:SagB-type dehydrogenase family enzyme
MAEKIIKLNKPQINNEFMKACQNRVSCRDYDPTKELSLQQLSDLLWCAYGNNRQNKVRQKHHFLAYKTVPSACAAYPLELYAVTRKGIYLYDPDNEELKLIKEGNFMNVTGSQAFVPDSSLNIYIVTNYKKQKEFPNERIANAFKAGNTAKHCSLLDAGIVSQNISIYCEINGLKSVVRGELGDVKKMRELLNLDEDKEPVLAQSVGFIKEKDEKFEFAFLDEKPNK